MGIGDKMKNKAEELGGKAKEGVGDATDNHSLEAEGRADQTEAHGKQAGENVKDALREASEAVKGDDRR
ncbi:MAG TPA: CsbD family protein [Microlunatus sp.]|nr:CsbD family protein [Microlunatus sp.]